MRILIRGKWGGAEVVLDSTFDIGNIVSFVSFSASIPPFLLEEIFILFFFLLLLARSLSYKTNFSSPVPILFSFNQSIKKPIKDKKATEGG